MRCGGVLVLGGIAITKDIAVKQAVSTYQPILGEPLSYHYNHGK